MIIEEEVRTLLSADAGILALLTPDRIKPPGQYPSLTRPYITSYPSNTTHPVAIYMQEGRAALQCWDTYQILCYADLYSDSRSVSQAVVNALSGQHDGVNFFWTDQVYTYDATTKLHCVNVYFEVYEAL